MLNRVVMDVIHVAIPVLLVPDAMLPKSPLPNTLLAFEMLGTRRFAQPTYLRL
jgi:hypothetical protein